MPSMFDLHRVPAANLDFNLSPSAFNVGSSMFDVQIPLQPQRSHRSQKQKPILLGSLWLKNLQSLQKSAFRPPLRRSMLGVRCSMFKSLFNHKDHTDHKSRNLSSLCALASLVVKNSSIPPKVSPPKLRSSYFTVNTCTAAAGL